MVARQSLRTCTFKHTKLPPYPTAAIIEAARSICKVVLENFIKKINIFWENCEGVPRAIMWKANCICISTYVIIS